MVEGGSGYYDFGTIRLERVGDPVLNPIDPVTTLGIRDGTVDFVPLEAKINYTVQVQTGNFGVGKEYIWTGTEWIVAQEKLDINQAPLFNLYDDNGVILNDAAVYPDSTFAGNQIFGYSRELPVPNTNSLVKETNADSELDFNLIFRQFKASSEIVFEHYLLTQSYNYLPVGSETLQSIPPVSYYKLDHELPEYYNAGEKSASHTINAYSQRTESIKHR